MKNFNNLREVINYPCKLCYTSPLIGSRGHYNNKEYVLYDYTNIYRILLDENTVEITTPTTTTLINRFYQNIIFNCHSCLKYKIDLFIMISPVSKTIENIKTNQEEFKILFKNKNITIMQSYYINTTFISIHEDIKFSLPLINSSDPFKILNKAQHLKAFL